MTTWNNNWYKNPIKETDYLKMARFIYGHYDNIVQSLPVEFVPKMQIFLTINQLSLGFDLWLASTGILTNPEIGRRLVHWLTVEVEAIDTEDLDDWEGMYPELTLEKDDLEFSQ